MRINNKESIIKAIHRFVLEHPDITSITLGTGMTQYTMEHADSKVVFTLEGPLDNDQNKMTMDPLDPKLIKACGDDRSQLWLILRSSKYPDVSIQFHNTELILMNGSEVNPHAIPLMEELKNIEYQNKEEMETMENLRAPLAALRSKINIMRQYIQELREKEPSVITNDIINLPGQLTQLIANFTKESPNHENFIRFKREFTTRLHSQDALMQTHRKQWKIIVANVLIALTGVGLVCLAIKGIKAAQSGKLGFNSVLFYSKTTRSKLIDQIDHTLNQVPDPDATAENLPGSPRSR